MTKWQYGVVIDAGSSGSRVHIYRWLKADRAIQDASDRELHSLPVVKSRKELKIKPGVSTFGSTPDLVGEKHLQELFDYADTVVPEKSRSSTPIFLLATAGMRLLSDKERSRLLEEICAYTKSTTNYLITDCDLHFQVIPGETEGLYGWIAANYLLGGFDAPEEHDHGKNHHTYGFLDMGGASAQIAFAPNTTEAIKHADDLKLLRFRKVNGDVAEYKVFVTTWLEYGVHEARRRYVEALLKQYDSSHDELPDPCLPEGLQISTKGDILTPDKLNGKTAHMVGTANFQECLRATFPLLNKYKACIDPPCLLNGVHVPAIDFDVNHFVGVSEYWHTTHEIFEMGHKDKAYDLKTYQQRVDKFCGSRWTDIQKDVEAQTWGKKVSESTAAEVCFKASWLINMLHDGIGIPRVGLEHLKNGHNGTKEVLDGIKNKGFTDPFQAVNKIDGSEVSWTLGKAVLYAASEIPPKNTNTLPVGFGSNKAGVPVDFQFAGINHVVHPSKNTTESGSWKNSLLHGTSPRRVPGLFLFMVIICIAVFLLCGKDRRTRFYQKVLPRRWTRRWNKGGLFGNKPFLSSSTVEQRQHLLESGLTDPYEFELNSIDGVMDEDLFSDDSSSIRKGKTSGYGTPRLRTFKSETNLDNAFGIRSETSGVQNQGFSGLFVRTESRESLTRGEGRSRRGSPTRFKSSPLLGNTIMD
ncbi:MAG: hypothetical protein GOMPHAMPRED_007492 [Gomphillus americanus]|uniref:Apyrase n=1 Tax=Gomphillus americanus TaxID=1940652 RepID=A0A8H3EWR3_9LECA|nr:MAG: hypothetical protein GOMPHAMPRED_007492 [Gomphillus americanus]